MARILFFLVLVVLPVHLTASEQSYDVAAFGGLPVLHEGRVKPIDTVARTALMFIHGKQQLNSAAGKLSATEWLMQAMMDPSRLEQIPMFRIDHPEVLGLIHKEAEGGKYTSFDELMPYAPEIQFLAMESTGIERGEQTGFQRAISLLFQQMKLYLLYTHTLQLNDDVDPEEELSSFTDALSVWSHGEAASEDKVTAFFERYLFLAESAQMKVLPPTEGDDRWLSVGDGLLMGFHLSPLHSGIPIFLKMADAYRSGQVERFNALLVEYRNLVGQDHGGLLWWTHIEMAFNAWQPFLVAMLLYALSFALVAIYWCWPHNGLRIAAWSIATAAWVLHTGGLAMRMLLQGRPPVTNLYSSAIYIGWAAVVACLLLERRLQRGLALAVASVIGGTTLIIAHNLQGGQDSIEMMRAVLDSNFWLSTHVVAITTGYSATFVAGALATIYIVRRLIVGTADATASRLAGTVYGVTCFALLFSFVGTVLGGIWADQSWGRFWGWDPKENGALLIVLWNASLLHARWGRMVSDRSFAALVVIGNIITSLSWFGVNLLGVGLHSYGFMEGPFIWLVYFAISQLFIASLAFLPLRKRA